MNHPVLTVLIAGFLPIVCAGISKFGAKDYDNHNPREWLARQTGMRLRADAAQKNSFEAFPLFAVGILLALHNGVDAEAIAQCGWAFVLMRIGYIACYVADKALLRSVFWGFALAAVIRLYVLAW